MSVIDLPAAKAKYHFSCYSNFITSRNIPLSTEPEESKVKRMKVGQKVDKVAYSAFLKVIEYLDNHRDDQNTVNSLVNIMSEFLKDSQTDAYSTRYMKQKLIEHYGQEILFTNVAGKIDVVTFKENAISVLHKHFEENKVLDNENIQTENNKADTLLNAAQIIEGEIKDLILDDSFFPDLNNLTIEESINYLPNSLKIFLQAIITCKKSDLKVAAIGQAIMQAC